MNTNYTRYLADDIHSIHFGINDRRVISRYYINNQPMQLHRHFDKQNFYSAYMNSINPVTGHIHKCTKTFRRYLLFMYYLHSSNSDDSVTYEKMPSFSTMDLSKAPLLTIHIEDVFPKIYSDPKYTWLRNQVESSMADFIYLTLDFYSNRVNSILPFKTFYDLCVKTIKPKPFIISYYNEDGSINTKKQNQFTEYYNKNLSYKTSYVFTYPSAAHLSSIRYLFLFLMLSNIAYEQFKPYDTAFSYYSCFYELPDDMLLDLLEDQEQVDLYHTCRDTYMKYNIYYHSNPNNIFHKDSKLTNF